VSGELPDLAAIKQRLLRAGYPPPGPNGEEATEPRATTREAAAARAELREHIIADVWALIAALEHQQRNA